MGKLTVDGTFEVTVPAVLLKPRLQGVNRAAQKLGCCQSHLSRVMYGERKPGKELEKKMRKLGLVPGSAA